MSQLRKCALCRRFDQALIICLAAAPALILDAGLFEHCRTGNGTAQKGTGLQPP